LSILQDYYSANFDLKNSRDGLERILVEKLDPKQPLLRTRLVALHDDFEASSRIALDAYFGCLPWTIHTSENLVKFDKDLKIVTFDDRIVFQDLETRRLNNGLPFSDKERYKHEDLGKKISKQNQKYLSQIETERQLGMEEDRRTSEALYKATIRAFLFSCRSYQDAIYALFLISKRQKVSERTSMKTGINNPDFVNLVSGTGYVEWFKKLRDLRNLAKVGATAGVGLGSLDIRVCYDDARDNRVVKVGGNDFSFSELTQSMAMTAHVLHLIVTPRN